MKTFYFIYFISLRGGNFQFSAWGEKYMYLKKKKKKKKNSPPGEISNRGEFHLTYV